MSSATSSKSGCSWLLLGLVLAAFILRAYRLDLQDIWWDEARNIDVAGRALTQIAAAPELDIHPPVYFYLLHGWLAAAGPHTDQLPGQGAFAARFLSLWFGVLLVPLMAALGRRVGGRWTGLGAAVGAAFLPFLLGEAQETRMYTVTLVWLACAGLAVLRAGERDQGSGGRSQGAGGNGRWWISRNLYWLLFALFSALALLTHYAAVFALVVLWGWAVMWALLGEDRQPVLQTARWQRLRTVLLAGLLTALLCLPGLPVALRQIPSYRNPNLVVPPVGGYLAELARVYGLGEHLDAAAAQPWVWALAGWLVIGWVLGLVMGRRGRRGDVGEAANGCHTPSHHAPRNTQYALRPRLGHPASPHLLPGHPRPGNLCHALHQLCAAGLAAAGRAGAGWLGEGGTLGRRAGCGRAGRRSWRRGCAAICSIRAFSARTRAGW